MTYNLEALGDDDFQRLAQALIVDTFPKAQITPIGQADGGRDAFIFRAEGGRAVPDTVFQVKFSNNPSSRTERQAISDLIRSEAPKIARLIERGLTQYIFVTNVRGTSALDSGSIDVVNALATNNLKIDAKCWWRDDIEARLRLNPGLVWSFPAITRGSDVLSLLLTGKSEDDQRRKRALKTAVTTQFGSDLEVKFKEIDLRYPITDIYVDTPLSARDANIQDERLVAGSSIARNVPALATFLRMSRADIHTRLLVEGAPGQGKSTITQMLCQVNRSLFLGHDLNVAQDWIPSTLRIPIRADLRDYASWLLGKSPFASTLGQPRSGDRSLDAFLAALIAQGSGGVQVTVNDLHALFQRTRLLLVLDGFDEVADPAARLDMANEIDLCLNRLEQTCLSVQAIVTSRPSALLTTPVFSEPSWTPIVLRNLTPSLAFQYLTKWSKVKHLSEEDESELNSVFLSKIEEPHIVELSRNPMQLSILASLINSQGDSLPSKRTNLYSDYIRLFFDRECHKSASVRQHRQLLIMLHEYLAYVIHCDAESDNKNEDRRPGSLTLSELKFHLRAFLEHLGHEHNILDGLFNAMKERVVALVQNVQGTYEFQVQPLREYFAAQYLYGTAVTVPGIVDGSRPQRFRGIARNSYWQNVTRFYAGCYNTGELSSLIDETIDIGNEEPFRNTTYRYFALKSYLDDYVLENQPRLISRVIEAICTHNQIDILLSSGTAAAHDSNHAIPERCGAVSFAMAIIGAVDVNDLDRVLAACRIVGTNLPHEECLLYFRRIVEHTAFCDMNLSLAWHLGIFHAGSDSVIQNLIEQFGAAGIMEVLFADRLDFFTTEERGRLLLEAIIDFDESEMMFHTVSFSECIRSVLVFFSYVYMKPSDEASGELTVRDQIFREGGRVSSDAVGDSERFPGLAKELRELAQLGRELLDVRLADVPLQLSIWGRGLAIALEEFGLRPSLIGAISRWCVSFCAGEEYSAGVRVRGLEDWIDACAARDDENWWQEAFLAAGSDEIAFVELTKRYFAYGVPQRFGRVLPSAARCFAKFDEICRRSISSSAAYVVGNSSRALEAALSTEHMEPVFAAMMNCVESEEWAKLVKDRPHLFFGSENYLAQRAYRSVMEQACGGAFDWRDALDIAARARKERVVGYFYSGTGQDIPVGIAKEICSATDLYPLSLVRLAEQRLRTVASAAGEKVNDIAVRERWFAEPRDSTI